MSAAYPQNDLPRLKNDYKIIYEKVKSYGKLLKNFQTSKVKPKIINGMWI